MERGVIQRLLRDSGRRWCKFVGLIQLKLRLLLVCERQAGVCLRGGVCVCVFGQHSERVSVSRQGDVQPRLNGGQPRVSVIRGQRDAVNVCSREGDDGER